MAIFSILREAPDDNNDTKKIEIDAKVDDEATDYGKELPKEEDTDDNTEGDDSDAGDDTDNNNDDDNTDNSEDEPTDYTAELQDSESAESDDDSTETDDTGSEEEVSPEQIEENKRNATLMKSVISLYYNIEASIRHIDDLTLMNALQNRIIIQVKKNFSEIHEMLYDFIVNKYTMNSYAKNLYIYNYFIESYKISIEMLAKISSNEE